MTWLKYLTVVPAIIDLVQLIRRRRRGVSCPDDERTATEAGREIVNAGREASRDVKRRKR